MQNRTIYLISAIFNAAIPFLFIPILTRVLSTEDFGKMNLLVTIYSLLVPIVSIGCSGYLFRRYFDANGLSRGTFMRCLKVLLIWTSIVLGVSIILVSLVLFKFDAYEYSEIIIFMPLLVITGLCNAIYMVRLQMYIAMNKPYGLLFFQSAYTLSIFIVTLILIFAMNQTFNARISGIVFSDLVFCVISVFLILKFCTNANLMPEENEERGFLRFGFGLMPHMVSSVLLSTIDKFIIVVYLTIQDLAIYAVAAQFSAIVMIYMQGITKEWSRTFLIDPYSLDINKKACKLIFGLCGVVFSLYLGQDIYYSFLVGEGFRSGLNVINVLLVAQLFHCCYMVLAIQITYEKKTYILSIFTVFSAVINLILSLHLVLDYGILGVAFGTLLGMLCKLLCVSIYVFYVRRTYFLNKGQS